MRKTLKKIMGAQEKFYSGDNFLLTVNYHSTSQVNILISCYGRFIAKKKNDIFRVSNPRIEEL